MFKTMWHTIVKFLLTFALMTVLFQPSCNFSSNKNNGNVDRNGEKKMLTASQNIDELVRTLKLKHRPTQADWIEEKLGTGDDSIPGPTDYRLVAVMKYSTAEATQIVEEAEKNGKALSGTTEIEDWFPEELKKNRSEEISCFKYSSDGFINSPYSGGTLFRVKETNTFILRLNTF